VGHKGARHPSSLSGGLGHGREPEL
jgi:hypothetical protein